MSLVISDGKYAGPMALTVIPYLAHSTAGALAHKEVRGVEVDVHHGQPIGIRHLLSRSGEAEAGVVAENVDAAEVLLDVGHGLLDLLDVRDVASVDVGLNAQGLDVLGHCLEAVLAAGDKGDLRPVAREGLSRQRGESHGERSRPRWEAAHLIKEKAGAGRPGKRCMVETMGFEPTTSGLQSPRSPS